MLLFPSGEDSFPGYFASPLWTQLFGTSLPTFKATKLTKSDCCWIFPFFHAHIIREHPAALLDRSRMCMKTGQIKFLTLLERSCIVFGVMNVLAPEKRLAVINALLEGNSIRSTERMMDVNRNTIMSLLARVGDGCTRLLNEKIRGVPAKRVQVDEIWTFVFVKQARLNGNHNHAEMGDQYVFVAMDADTKLVISHLVGKRDAVTAWHFMQDLKERLATRVQLTTDGFKPYLNAVEDAFGADVDFAQLVKLYGQPKETGETRNWYEPVRVLAAIPMRVSGKPNTKWISTSYIERQNLTIRMQLRRFTRLTNGFSKKLANLRAAIALHFAHYNFVRIHQTLRITPAMAAQITSHVWDIEELLAAV